MENTYTAIVGFKNMEAMFRNYFQSCLSHIVFAVNILHCLQVLWLHQFHSLIEGVQVVAGDNTISRVFLLGKVKWTCPTWHKLLCLV